MLSGCLLGFLGLAVTRWEKTATATYYTPNRWLVLLITLAVAARMLYGFWRIWHVWQTSGHDTSWLAAARMVYSFWRIWHAWQTTGRDTSWLAAARIPGSMAVGALVLGYYLIYFAGVRWRLRL